MKTCTKCGETKDEREFKLTRHGHPGGKCMDCHLEYNRMKKREKKEPVKAFAWAEELSLWVRKAYINSRICY